jgi:uncharacterized membrane protein YbhN (UPF0104 family)
MPRLGRLRDWLLGLLLLALVLVVVELTLGWSVVLAPWATLPPLVLLGAFWLSAASYLLRAVRVRVYFSELLAGQGSFATVLRLSVLHNTANNLLPMRAGELVFPWLMQRYFGQGFLSAGASLIWIRLLDLHFLGLIGVLVLWMRVQSGWWWLLALGWLGLLPLFWLVGRLPLVGEPAGSLAVEFAGSNAAEGADPSASGLAEPNASGSAEQSADGPAEQSASGSAEPIVIGGAEPISKRAVAERGVASGAESAVGLPATRFGRAVWSGWSLGVRFRRLVGLVARSAPRDARRVAWLYLWTALSWALKLFGFALILGHFVPVALWQVLFGVMGAELSTVLPFHGIAGSGSFELAAVAAMVPLGVAPAEALAGAVNLHLFLLGTTLLLGAMALWIPVRRRLG